MPSAVRALLHVFAVGVGVSVVVYCLFNDHDNVSMRNHLNNQTFGQKRRGPGQNNRTCSRRLDLNNDYNSQ